MNTKDQPHKFTIAWTVHRDHPPEAGGHFYIGSYCMHIQAASNTLVVWISTDVHGTSLQDLNQKDVDPEFLQTGITIITLNHLLSVWTNFCNSEMKYQEMVSSILKDLGEDEEVEDEEVEDEAVSSSFLFSCNDIIK